MSAPRGHYEGILSGFDATMYLFEKYEKEADKDLDQEIEDWARTILNRAKYYCPTSEGSPWGVTDPDLGPGYLRSTGQVVKDGLCRWSIVFGAWYAAYVHEVSTYHHRAPTRWKFLEVAVKEVGPQMAKEMSASGLGVRFRSFSDEASGARTASGYPFTLEGQ